MGLISLLSDSHVAVPVPLPKPGGAGQPAARGSTSAEDIEGVAEGSEGGEGRAMDVGTTSQGPPSQVREQYKFSSKGANYQSRISGNTPFC